MCLIIHAPTAAAAAHLATDASTIANAWARNPHGAGILWRDRSGAVHAAKGFMSLSGLMAALRRVAKLSPAELAVHCRVATHGPAVPALTHPFSCRWGAFMHNGIFDLPAGAIRRGESDTAAVARMVHRLAWHDAVAVLGAFCEASGSRAIAMSRAETVRLGTWYEHGGMWHSNPALVPCRLSRFVAMDELDM